MTLPLDVTDTSLQLEEWLVELRDRAMLGSTNQSFAMLRAFLQELRDRLSVDDALRLADALPALVRGIMLGGWHPETAGPGRGPSFLDGLSARIAEHHAPPDSIVDAALAVLAHRVYPQLLPVVGEHLPPELREGWRRAVEGEGRE